MRAIAIALTLCLGGTALAYDWSGVKWPREPISYVVSNDLSGDVPDRDCLEAIQLGYQVWTDLSCSYMVWVYDGRTANTAWGAGDGENIATWREQNWGDSATALGIAAWQTGLGGNIADCDIKFNGQDHSWAHFEASGPGGFDGRTDIASVGAHEAGHCIGLGHSDVGGSTMWPSTGPGDTNGRSLGADDIAGACEIYPSGGDVPDPDVDPEPPVGDQEFGEDCSEERCIEALFCVSDGRESYCSRACETADDCGAGYFCATIAGGGGSCAKGENPVDNLASFGEACGEEVRCEASLTCVNDDGSLYCSGPCLNGECPGDFFCAELPNGEGICARSGPGGDGPLPEQGEPCNDRGLCAQGYFCLNDPTNVDEETGERVPYCTTPCPDRTCPEDFRCVDVAPSGTACQLIPSAGDRSIGEVCWVNPERPFDPPSCGDGLVCVDWEIVNQEVVEKGFCTKNCTPDDCCPEGWGCAELTPVIGQCREGQNDGAGFECQGDRPEPGAGGAGGNIDVADGGINPGAGGEGGSGQNPEDEEGSGGGCSSVPASSALWGLLVLGLIRRRR